jgi:hypothetical protein
MPIKSIGVSTTAKRKPSSEQPELVVSDALITGFIETSARSDQVDAELAAAKTALITSALPKYFDLCANHNAMFSTVVLAGVDDNGQTTGDSVKMTLQNKYPVVDRSKATALFSGMSKDPGDFCDETVDVKFNSKIFTVNGTFNTSLFLAMNNAVSKVARDFGVENPLVSETVIRVKPDFHASRVASFTPKQNLAIQESIPMTIALKR